MTTEKEIAGYIKSALLKAQEEKKIPLFKMPEVLVDFPENRAHGDYTTNLAFLLAKSLKKSPQEIARLLKKHIPAKEPIEKIEVMEPGFINFWLSKKSLNERLKAILKEKESYGSGNDKGIMVIDYSAPNIAKPFGVGHLRSTIIGQAIYNIYQFLGWKSVGDNHIGDWGTQFGKLIVAIKKWSQKEVEKLSINELEELYVKFHQEAESKPELVQEGRQWFQKLEQGDKEAKSIWQACVKTSIQEFERIYKILGVSFDNALGESFYEDKMEKVIGEALKKGIARKSQGALVIFVPGFKAPLMLLKSDGTTTYQTRELATIKHRMETWKPDIIVYEVGADQKEHLAKCFAAAEMIGYARKEQLVHMAHGLIKWKHGKFSTRKGETIHLEGILKESIQRAQKLIENSKTEKNITEEEKKQIAEIVGIGAIKYSDLSRHHSRDIVFDWEAMFNLEGNSGPYIQYTAVRCQSILEKGEQKLNVPQNISFAPEEELLLRLLYRFPETVKQSAEKFSPNLICAFAFELAQAYNLFYEKCPVLRAENQRVRRLRTGLTAATRQVLLNSLKLLGISVPRKM